MTIIAAGAIRPLAEPLPPDRHADAGGSGFTVATMAATGTPPSRQGASQTGGASPMSGPGALLALQEQAGQDAGYAADVGDREARKHGKDILEALEELQKKLLSGGTPARSLSRLNALAQMTPTVRDPVLGGILDAIHLRAKLEILRMSSSARVKQYLDSEAEGARSMTEM